MNVFARSASAGLPWPVIACFRAFVGATIAFSVARGRGVTLGGLGNMRMWARTIFGTIAMTCTFYALGAKSLPLGDACTLFALTPVFIAVLAPRFLGERMGIRGWLAVALSSVGVVLVVRPPLLFGDHIAHREGAFPAFVAILSAVFSSFAMMMLRKIGREAQRITAESIVFHFSSTAAISLSILAIPTLATLPHLSEKTVVAMIIAGVCGGFAQLSMTRAFALETAARIGAFANLTVVLSTMGSLFVLGERVTIHSVIGMLLVISGSVFISLDGMRAPSAHFVPDPATVPPPSVR